MKFTPPTWDEKFDTFKTISLRGPNPLGRALEKGKCYDGLWDIRWLKKGENFKNVFFQVSFVCPNFPFTLRHFFKASAIRSPSAIESWNPHHVWHNANDIARLVPEPSSCKPCWKPPNFAFSLIFALLAHFLEPKTSTVGLNILMGC